MYIYLGDGDLAIQALSCCAHSTMFLPSEFYRCVSISIDFKNLDDKILYFLKTHEISLDVIIQRYCTDKAIAIFSNPYIENIFSILFSRSPYVNTILYKTKMMELLSYIYFYDLSREKRITEWNSQQIHLIKDIHNFLINNYGKRYTIEELSKKYLINTSSLKSTFKAVYGMPVATYMKEYRMKIAVDLLIHSTASISDIANQLGYETQSKFSKAFKDVMNMLPSEYRKTNKKTLS